VGNNYQRRLSKDTTRTQMSVPEQVTVGLGELTGRLAEGLLSLAVATGLQVMSRPDRVPRVGSRFRRA